MEIYDIVCGVCGSHDFKNVEGKKTCQGCGYILSDDDIQNILHKTYEASMRCDFCSKPLKAPSLKNHWKVLPDGKKICAKCIGQGNLKYFEFNNYAYYALICAETEEEATKEYQESVSDIEKNDGPPDEITEAEAQNKYAVVCKGHEDAEDFDIVITASPCVLVLDGGLI